MKFSVVAMLLGLAFSAQAKEQIIGPGDVGSNSVSNPGCHEVTVKVTPVELAKRPVGAPAVLSSDAFGETSSVGHLYNETEASGSLRAFVEKGDGLTALFDITGSTSQTVCLSTAKVTLFFSSLDSQSAIKNYRLEVRSGEMLKRDIIMPIVGREVQRDQFPITL